VIEGVRFAHTVLSVCLSTLKWHCTSVGNVVVPQATMFPRYTHTTAHRHSHHCHWCAAQSVHTHPPQARHFPPVLSLLKLANTHIQPLPLPPMAAQLSDRLLTQPLSTTSTSTNGCAALRSPAHPTTFHHSHFHQWLRSSLPTKESCWQAPFTGCRQSQDSSLQEWTTQESRSVTATALPLRDTLLLLRHPAQISNCLKRVRSAC
jgi:hypothetical protein